MRSIRRLCVVCLLIVRDGFGISPAQAQTYYSLQGGSGAQFQIGDELSLPINPSVGTAGYSISPFPPLLIPVNPNPAKALVKQTAGADPKRMTVPAGVLLRKAPGAQVQGAAARNSKLFQVRTRNDFSVPAPASGSAVFKVSGRTGAATATFPGPEPGQFIRYKKTTAQFGGPSRARIVAVTPIRFWLRPPGAKVPCKHPIFGGADASCVAPLVNGYPGTRIAAGAMTGLTTTTPGGPSPMSPGVVALSGPNPVGAVAKSASIAMTFASTNMATSFGFPWTTGQIRFVAPSALGSPESFTITGMDERVFGVGKISLVSGALSTRTITGPNANRGWARYTLPEPGAALGAVVALAVLTICHGLVRRRLR